MINETPPPHRTPNRLLLILLCTFSIFLGLSIEKAMGDHPDCYEEAC